MPTVQVTVRDAAPSDAAIVATLLTELGYPASTEFAAERIGYFRSDSLSRVQLAEVNGEVVGLVCTHVVPRLDSEMFSCRIVDIVVAQAHRRSGIGATLVGAAEIEARRHRCQRLDLSSGDWRADAHAFYDKLGFEGLSRGFVKRLA
jgi:GNAT superfamily N-acetyltransferase